MVFITMRSEITNASSIFLTILCQSFVHLSAKHAALVIDRFDSSLYDLPSNPKPDTECGAWANACPAKNDADKTFVSKKAITENALFVEQTCEKELTMEQAKFKTDICDNPFRISVVFSKIDLVFEFGYEIYYQMEKESLFHTHYRRKYYIDSKKLFKSIDKKSKLTRVILEGILNLISKEKKVHWHNGNRKLRFMWIGLFKIEFNFFEWTPKKISYQIRSNSVWPVAFSCKKYDLANEAYEGVNLDNLYSEDNQNEIFSDVVLPGGKFAVSCQPNCLEKWLLIPIDQFNFGTLDYISCSNMATVPIWGSTIRKIMMKLEKFLYALYQASNGELSISSGISGQLRLPREKRTWKEWKNSKKAMYLDAKNEKIPVPSIIYKVVKYEPKDCPEDDKCVYSATIIIHNDPNFKKKICEDVTLAWSWREITRDITVQYFEDLPNPSPYIYVCKTNSKLLLKLMGLSARGEPYRMKDLKLDEFPSYNASGNFVSLPMDRLVNEALSMLNNREKELRREHDIEEDNVNVHISMPSYLRVIKRPITLNSIMEIESGSETDGVVSENEAGNDIVEESQGEMVASPVDKELNQQIQKESSDEDTLSDGVQPSSVARARLLCTTPNKSDESGNENEENEDDGIPDWEIRGQSFHKDDPDAETKSENEENSFPEKSIKVEPTGSNLEEQSSPRKSQSLDEENVSTMHDLKYEEISHSEDSTNVAISSNVKGQSSPGKE